MSYYQLGLIQLISGEVRKTDAFTLGLLVFRIMKTKNNSSVIVIQYLFRIINIILLTQFGEMIASTVLLFIDENVRWVRLNEIKMRVTVSSRFSCSIVCVEEQQWIETWHLVADSVSALHCSLVCCSCSLFKRRLCSVDYGWHPSFYLQLKALLIT